jgi:hypothetical protein
MLFFIQKHTKISIGEEGYYNIFGCVFDDYSKNKIPRLKFDLYTMNKIIYLAFLSYYKQSNNANEKQYICDLFLKDINNLSHVKYNSKNIHDYKMVLNENIRFIDAIFKKNIIHIHKNNDANCNHSEKCPSFVLYIYRDDVETFGTLLGKKYEHSIREIENNFHEVVKIILDGETIANNVVQKKYCEFTMQ